MNNIKWVEYNNIHGEAFHTWVREVCQSPNEWAGLDDSPQEISEPKINFHQHEPIHQRTTSLTLPLC